MEDGFIKIILFAVLAAFLVFRLRRELGKRSGHERPRHDEQRLQAHGGEEVENGATDNVLQMPDRGDESEPPGEPAAQLVVGITKIKVFDPEFDIDDFQAGAKAAFEIIVSAFAAGDSEVLRPLLSRDVYGNFAGAIEERARADEQMQTTVVGIKGAEVIEADLEGRDAVVTVKFVSEQINVTRDRDGKVTDGDPERIVTVTDIWTFQRSTRSSDPNWSLVATRTPN